MDLPGFYVDVNPVIQAFNPRTSQSYYYTTSPELREVVSQITVERIIECVFVLPANDLQENGLTSVLYEYIEHSCLHAMEILENNPDALYGLDNLIDDIAEVTDTLLRNTLNKYTANYQAYVFDHWAASGLAAFLRHQNES